MWVNWLLELQAVHEGGRGQSLHAREWDIVAPDNLVRLFKFFKILSLVTWISVLVTNMAEDRFSNAMAM